MVLVTPLVVYVLVHMVESSSDFCDSEDDYYALFQTASPEYMHRIADDNVADASGAEAGNTAILSSRQSEEAEQAEHLKDEVRSQSDMLTNKVFGDDAASGDDDMSGGAWNTAMLSRRRSQQAGAPDNGVEGLSWQERDTAYGFGSDRVTDDLRLTRDAPFVATPLLQRPPSPYELEFSQRAIGRVHFSNDDDDGDVSNGLTRPNLGKGPDIVHFGIFVEQYFGMNLKDNTFTVDMVSTTKWLDHRAAAKVPAGLQNFTMSENQAKKEIWVPRVAVTNANIRKVEDISTSFSIHISGEVQRICRNLVEIKQKFILNNFPFDSQELEIRIASTKYMAGQVVLAASTNPSISGITSNAFDGEAYYLENWRLLSLVNDMGGLKKSRGVLEMNVKRDPTEYFNNQLLPSILLMMLSCGVFCFPFTPQFVTPRLALSILALISLQKLSEQCGHELPTGHPQNWNEILNQNMLLCMVINCILNVYTEIHCHVTKVDELAKRINTELRWGTPAVSGTAILFIYICGSADLMSQTAVNILCRVVLIGGTFLYLAWGEYRVSQESPPGAKPQDS